jgi:MFS family permease
VGTVSLTAPLRQRDFRLLWTGMSVSLLGDGVFLVAVAWETYGLSNHPASLAYVGVALSLPQVAMLLIGGAVSDRWRCRSILIWADSARALAVGVLAALTASGGLHLWELYVAAGTLGVAAAFAAPAFDALVPQLIPVDQLHQANAIEQFVRPATIQLAGPAFGGLAVATIGSVGALAFDAVTFVFSALCMVRMHSHGTGSATDTADGGGIGQEVREGLRYVRRHVWLWGTFVSATFTYLLIIGPTQVLLPYIVRNTVHQSASTYGIVLAAGGVGALVGALATGRSREPRRPMTWIYGWWTAATLGVAGYGVFEKAWGLVVAALVVNGAEAVGAVVWVTTKQRRVPRAMLGRVSSIDWLVSTALLPLSYALTPPVAQLLGARTTLVLAGTIGAAVTLGFLFLPGMRRGDTVGGSARVRATAAPLAHTAARRGADRTARSGSDS